MKITFFDEAGIKSPDAGNRLYGHAPVAGEGCVEVERKHERKENPNTTLNILVSLNAVGYHNMLDGATDTVQFQNFFEEAAHSVNFEAVCKCGRKMLEDYLAEMGIEFLYTPLYSPDLNNAEL